MASHSASLQVRLSSRDDQYICVSNPTVHWLAVYRNEGANVLMDALCCNSSWFNMVNRIISFRPHSEGRIELMFNSPCIGCNSLTAL